MYSARTNLGSKAIDAEIVDWVDARGFGFARPASGGSDIFVHVVVLRRAGLGEKLAKGQRVRIATEPGRDGRLRACAIGLAGPDSRAAAADIWR
ncbi:MAG TPA: cold shock domain-containing protein [Stellaceae bacterium]|nr:cold shock domain-containing protein [Stellaceae bacterium]